MIRKLLRNLFFLFLRKLTESEDFQELLDRARHAHPRGPVTADWLQRQAGESRQLYTELFHGDDTRTEGRTAVFVTGRFRSGTTVLWNICRRLPQFTAYYEPLNERRWFDEAARGSWIDQTHRGVAHYWLEYEGLEQLADVYDEDWIRRRLYLPEYAWEPRLKAYLDKLINHAQGGPVLQFNRLDLRLPWARRNYPHARIVHICRHPRDQWCSVLQEIERFPKDTPLAEFPEHDKFYLRMWVNDLRYAFPFLDDGHVEHPYQWSYYLWKLSLLFARQFADHVIRFEDLIADPRAEMAKITRGLNVSNEEISHAVEVVQPTRLGRWREYADDAWFRRLESRCEQVLADFFHTATTGPKEVDENQACLR